MQQVTSWTAPCGCQVAYAWDDTEPEATRTHRAIAATPCAVHEADAAGAPRVAARYSRAEIPTTAHPAAARALAAIHRANREPD